MQRIVAATATPNHNDKGKTDGKLYRIAAEQLGRGPEFVCFMLATGKGVWKGGARLLSHLQEDIDHQTYMRDIYVINYYGYHADSQIWFFGDCAFGPNGDLIEADKYNIFWHRLIRQSKNAAPLSNRVRHSCFPRTA